MTDTCRTGPTRLMTIADAAETLAVSPRTVRRLIDQGALTATRVGRQIRVHPADLNEYLARSRQSGRSWPDLTSNV
jgi:excisionase family DNA binding protein